MLFVGHMDIINLSPLILLLILLPVMDQDKLDVVVSSKLIEAKLGDNVVLPCKVEPPIDLTDFTVEWQIQNSSCNESAHVYRHKKDDPQNQCIKYKGRTSLFYKELKHGNISLKLANVTEKDAGDYTCSVITKKKIKNNITLKVDDNDGNQATVIPPGDTDSGQGGEIELQENEDPVGNPDEQRLNYQREN